MTVTCPIAGCSTTDASQFHTYILAALVDHFSRSFHSFFDAQPSYLLYHTAVLCRPCWTPYMRSILQVLILRPLERRSFLSDSSEYLNSAVALHCAALSPCLYNRCLELSGCRSDSDPLMGCRKLKEGLVSMHGMRSYPPRLVFQYNYAHIS